MVLPVILPSANVKIEELRGEIFATSTWQAASEWNIEAGMTVEFSQIKQSGDANRSQSFKFYKPRLGCDLAD